MQHDLWRPVWWALAWAVMFSGGCGDGDNARGGADKGMGTGAGGVGVEDGGPDDHGDGGPTDDAGTAIDPVIGTGGGGGVGGEGDSDGGSGGTTCTETPETCDGLDNDCDDLVDEAWPTLGTPCTVGKGRCRAEGRWVCGDADPVCDATEGEPTAERCNGLDDDCDGEVDEGNNGPLSEACYDGPSGTNGLGACAPGIRTCGAGVWGACTGTTTPTDEICDGVDQDCDGTVDEAAADVDQPCEADGALGACGAGRTVCSDGQPVCLAAEPQPEQCNGFDDDCDGQTDEAVPGVGEACVADGLGACGVGVLRCGAEGLWCEPAAEASPETCNGIDDDCDGAIDEAAPAGGACQTDQLGACGPGVEVCQGGALVCQPSLQPGDETCNGIDDDCDGTTDEGAPAGAPCDTGLPGACQAGAEVCRDGALVCVQGAQPGDEVCNGRDDDCDGATDEALPVGPDCATGALGQCAAGRETCVDGAVACVQQQQPDAETCNGRDDDCDGRADEDVAAGLDCDTGLPGVCGPGATACLEGEMVCLQVNDFGPETCNGLDDDCDDQIDEEVAAGSACPTGLPGVCAAGATACLEGEMACVQIDEVGPETCNGLDDDCDGAVDEEVAQGADCQTGLPGVCSAGATICLEGELICAQVAEQGPEQCNGLDDDCDDQIDEEVPPGAACQTQQLGACAVGAMVCVDGAMACTQTVAPGAETCNGIDDDCDGTPDEGLPDGPACDTQLPGVCQPGTLICLEGEMICAQDAEQGPEQCNGLDDDCDDQIDEEVPDGPGCDTGGVGECGVGVMRCVGAEMVCHQMHGPAPESCNGVDDDCDGQSDEGLDAGPACDTGLPGVCADGVDSCLEGSPYCRLLNEPGPEICDGLDNDCDGVVDQGCFGYPSCLVALELGEQLSGVYPIAEPGGVLRQVYCDQETDGGGWTLVGSSQFSTLQDVGGGWHDDLTRLAPQNSTRTLWRALRDRSALWDVRTTCRAHISPDPAVPFDVDLSFYQTPWYGEWTKGPADEDSCFNPADVPGPRPRPARRNNLNGQTRQLGDPWVVDGDLAGELTCGDVDSFTVDFDDRGMGGNPQDGTDWGNDDGVLKCGVEAGLSVTGQWLVFVRERAPQVVRLGEFRVGEGMLPGEAQATACVSVCASQFGGVADDYLCSTNAGQPNERAFVDLWGADTHHCQGEGVADTFVVPAEGAAFDCGVPGCASSAFVGDDEACLGATNYCWRRLD